MDGMMMDFKWCYFQGDVILWVVCWYCCYLISYCDFEEMLVECGILVDYMMIYCWVQCYVLEMEKWLCWFWWCGFDLSWCLDEIYVKVWGKWIYLYWVVDKWGDMIDFYLLLICSVKVVKWFLGKVL